MKRQGKAVTERTFDQPCLHKRKAVTHQYALWECIPAKLGIATGRGLFAKFRGTFFVPIPPPIPQILLFWKKSKITQILRQIPQSRIFRY